LDVLKKWTPDGLWKALREKKPIFLLPTLAFTWDRVKMFGGKQEALYKSFINEMDNLKYNQV
jgi:hypothetical protein